MRGAETGGSSRVPSDGSPVSTVRLGVLGSRWSLGVLPPLDEATAPPHSSSAVLCLSYRGAGCRKILLSTLSPSHALPCRRLSISSRVNASAARVAELLAVCPPGLRTRIESAVDVEWSARKCWKRNDVSLPEAKLVRSAARCRSLCGAQSAFHPEYKSTRRSSS